MPIFILIFLLIIILILTICSIIITSIEVQICNNFKAGGVKINKKIYGGIKDELDKILLDISNMSDFDPDTIIAKIETKFNNIKRQYDNEKQDTMHQIQQMNELNEQLTQEYEQLDSKTKYQMGELLVDKDITEEKLSRLIDLLDSELYIEKSKQKLYPTILTIFTDEWFENKKKLLIDIRKGLKSTSSLLMENEKKMHNLEQINDGLVGLLNEFKDEEANINAQHNEDVEHYLDQIKQLLDKHRSDTQVLENVHQIKIDHYETRIRDLLNKHQIKIEELNEEQKFLARQLMQCDSEKDRLNKYYAQQLQLQEQGLTAEHNTQMGKLTATYSQRVKEYELRLKGYFEQLAQLKTNHEAKIEELTHEFEKEMSHVIISHGEEIQILEYSHKQEMDALNKHYTEEMEDLQSTIDILREQMLTMANKHKNELDSRERDYQNKLATLKLEYDADLNRKQRVFDENTRKLEHQMLDALDVNKSTINDAIGEFEKKHTSLSELLDKFKETYDKVYQQIKDTLRERYNKLEEKIRQLNLAQIVYTQQFKEYLAKNDKKVKDLATLVKKISRMVNN